MKVNANTTKIRLIVLLLAGWMNASPVFAAPQEVLITFEAWNFRNEINSPPPFDFIEGSFSFVIPDTLPIVTTATPGRVAIVPVMTSIRIGETFVGVENSRVDLSIHELAAFDFSLPTLIPDKPVARILFHKNFSHQLGDVLSWGEPGVGMQLRMNSSYEIVPGVWYTTDSRGEQSFAALNQNFTMTFIPIPGVLIPFALCLIGVTSRRAFRTHTS